MGSSSTELQETGVGSLPVLEVHGVEEGVRDDVAYAEAGGSLDCGWAIESKTSWSVILVCFVSLSPTGVCEDYLVRDSPRSEYLHGEPVLAAAGDDCSDEREAFSDVEGDETQIRLFGYVEGVLSGESFLTPGLLSGEHHEEGAEEEGGLCYISNFSIASLDCLEGYKFDFFDIGDVNNVVYGEADVCDLVVTEVKGHGVTVKLQA